MNIIADLFALVAEDLVFSSLEVTFYELGEKAMELNSGVVWPSQASSPQTTSGHAKIASLLLHDHIRSHLGSTKKRVLRLVDRELLRDAAEVSGIRIVPARI